jgi:hypothetical protein
VRCIDILQIFEIDEHLGIAIAGLTADARVLCKYMRTECLNHRCAPASSVCRTRCICALISLYRRCSLYYNRACSLMCLADDGLGPRIHTGARAINGGLVQVRLRGTASSRSACGASRRQVTEVHAIVVVAPIWRGLAGRRLRCAFVHSFRSPFALSVGGHRCTHCSSGRPFVRSYSVPARA